MKSTVLMRAHALINVARKNVKCLAILLLAAGFFSCNEQFSAVEDHNDDWWGKGEGQIEFLGKNYPLVGAYSQKWTSFNPAPLAVEFFDDEMNGNHIAVTFSKALYDKWSSIELPVGIYENFHAEFTLNDGTTGYGCDVNLNETKMIVNKTNNEYDITITGKVLLILEINKDLGMETCLTAFRMTWKGEIKVSYEEIFYPR